MRHITRRLAGHAAVMVAATAMTLADRWLDRPRLPQHITVRPPDPTCRTCRTSLVPGVLWPAQVHGDTSHHWLERCDDCRRFTSDIQAATEIVRLGLGDQLGVAKPAGHPTDLMYVTPIKVRKHQ